MRVNYNEPYYIIDYVVSLTQDLDSGVTSTSKVLDVGAGTGLLGLKLKEKGLNLDMYALDATSQFVDRLKTRPEYTGARLVWLGKGVDEFDDDLKGCFDIVTAAGVFLKGHMPALAIDDCHAALKIGGYFVTAMRDCYWNHGNEEGYREKLDELVNSNKFQLIKTDSFQRGVVGEVGLFAPCQSHVMCFKKTA